MQCSLCQLVSLVFVRLRRSRQPEHAAQPLAHPVEETPRRRLLQLGHQVRVVRRVAARGHQRTRQAVLLLVAVVEQRVQRIDLPQLSQVVGGRVLGRTARGALNGNVGDGRRGNAAAGEAVGEVLPPEDVLELDVWAQEVFGPAGERRLVLFCEDLTG